jgi:hypothetical protein
MAVYFWNVFSGMWNDPASWLGEVAPGFGDQGVVAHGPLTNATVEFTGLTVEGQIISVVAANQLSFNGTTLTPETVLTNYDADGLTLSFSGANAFNGPVFLQSPASNVYLIPGTSASLTIGSTGSWDMTGLAHVMGQGTITNNGTIRIGTGGAPGVWITAGTGVGIVNDGLIQVVGMPSDLVTTTHAVFQGMSGTGIVSASHAEAIFVDDVASGLFQFADDSAILQLNIDTATYNAIIAGFKPGNRIDLGATDVDTATYLADPGGYTGTLTLSFEGNTVAVLNLDGFYSESSFVLSDIGGDMAVTVPCFAQGTLLATPGGEVAVEALAVGDTVLTADGVGRVVWTGWRRVECRRHPRPHDVLPVRVRADAFGPGVPARDVVLSPDHAVFQAGVLIPVRYLLNGATVVQERVRAVTYWHVELERHAVMRAAGLPVESYLDTGNRADFANGPGPRRLYPDFRPVDAMAVWEGRACAPLRLEGREVEAVRAALLARAGAMGWQRARGGMPRVLVDGREVAPVLDGRTVLVPLPRGARRLVLRSGAGVPRQMRPGAADGRSLGVAVADLAWDGMSAPLDDPRLVVGWQRAETGWRWTDGEGVVDVAGLNDVAFTVVATEQHWLAPERRLVA